MANSCGTCLHFAAYPGKRARGQCRRHAPTPISANLLKCLSVMAVGAMIEAQKTGLLETAVMDIRKGEVFDPAGRHAADAAGASWPAVEIADYCGDFEVKSRKQSTGPK